MTSLGRKLRVLRAERGLSMRQVEAGTGVAKETVSALENSTRRARGTTLTKLAAFYGVPVRDLQKLEAGLPPLELAAMMQEPDESIRRRMLEGAAPEQIARYLRDIDRSVIGAGTQLVSPEHQEPGEQEGLGRYMQALLDLREEAEPYTADKVEESHASVG